MGGMVGAFLSIFAVIAFVWGLTLFQHRGVENPARTIDYGAALTAARAQAPFAVLAPDPAPAGLRATSVTYDGVGPRKSWQLGFVDEGGQFVGLYQGNGPAADVIQTATPATSPGAPVTIDGDQWLTLNDTERGEAALVRTSAGVTTVVTGTAGEAALTAFATVLQ